MPHPVCNLHLLNLRRSLWGAATPCGHPYHKECWDQAVAVYNTINGTPGLALLHRCLLCKSVPLDFRLVRAKVGLGESGADETHRGDHSPRSATENPGTSNSMSSNKSASGSNKPLKGILRTRVDRRTSSSARPISLGKKGATSSSAKAQVLPSPRWMRELELSQATKMIDSWKDGMAN